METASIIKIVMGLIDKLLKQFPDYDERKKQKYIELKMEYNYEVNKPLDQRDADKILNLRDHILLIGEEVSK